MMSVFAKNKNDIFVSSSEQTDDHRPIGGTCISWCFHVRYVNSRWMCVIRVRLAVSPAYQAERTFAHRRITWSDTGRNFRYFVWKRTLHAGILRLVIFFFFRFPVGRSRLVSLVAMCVSRHGWIRRIFLSNIARESRQVLNISVKFRNMLSIVLRRQNTILTLSCFNNFNPTPSPNV